MVLGSEHADMAEHESGFLIGQGALVFLPVETYDQQSTDQHGPPQVVYCGNSGVILV